MNSLKYSKIIGSITLSLISYTITFPGFCLAEDSGSDPSRSTQPGEAADSPKAPLANAIIPTVAVTATRTETPIEDIGRSVEVRNEAQFQAQEITTLTSSLQDVSGVRAFDIGGPGAPGTTRLEIRGFRNGGTSLLVNGLKVSDPSSVNGTFEAFAPYLTVNDLQSVEVLKGGASVLYGSDGQAGAIQMRTKQPKPGTSVGGELQFGSYDTFQENAAINHGTDRGGVFASATRVDSRGLDTHGNYESTNALFVGRLDAVPETLTLSPIFRLTNGQNNLDTDPTADANGNLIVNQESPGNFVHNFAYLLGLTTTYVPTSQIESKLSVYTNFADRKFFFNFDNEASKSDFKGRTINVDWDNNFDLPEINGQLLAGSSYEHQSVDTETGGPRDSEQRDQIAGYLYNRYHFFDDLLQLGGGARVTQISDIGKAVTALEASGVFKIPATRSRLHSSIAEGFRAPTLFESKGKILDFTTGEVVKVGNPHLDEEQSTSFDVGVEQQIWDKRLAADVTYFQIDSDQTILFDFEHNTHLNGGGGNTRGMEYSLTATPCEPFTLRAAYTNLDQADGIDGARRQRTPRNWYSLVGIVKYDQVTASAEVDYRDHQQLELFGVPEQIREDGYTIVNSSLTYQIAPKVQAFVRGENLFDVNYTEAGFRMPGANAMAGVRFALD